MANNQDARPFVDLRKDAKEFRLKFDADIDECVQFLDEKLTTLICDPDSLGNPAKYVKQNALTEFSKAKYDIFIGVKHFINAKEREWIRYMSEMKKLFIENVEILLAGTKLEVKLPSSEYPSSLGPRKSPGNKISNSASVTSSLYPILDTITKNIPVLSSRRQGVVSKVPEEMSNVEDEVQFSRRGRLSASFSKLTDSLSMNAILSKERSDSSDSSLDEDQPGLRAMDVDESGFECNPSRSSFSSSTKKLNTSDLNTSATRRSLSKKEIDIDLNTSGSATRRRSLPKQEIALALPQKNASVFESHSDTGVSESDQLTSRVRGRRGKQTIVNSNVQKDESLVPSIKKSIQKQASKSKKNAISKKDNSSSEENEVKETHLDQVSVPVRGRRGRQAAKTNDSSTVSPPVNQVTENSNVVNGKEKMEEEIPAVKARRSRSAAVLKKTKNVSVSPPLNQIAENSNAVNGEEPMEEDISVVKSRRSRSAAALKNAKSAPGKNVISTRKGSKSLSQRATEIVTEEEVFEPEPPVVRSTKASARRKTLATNFEAISGTDVIPGIPAHSRSKRKTIGAPELEAAAPSKRLKVASRSTISSQEESAASDNLLESDEDYSQWMALKSVDGKIPTHPAVYEVKVWRAKKPAYIGSCENLRQKLTLYNLRQNSGHKHLDKFVERNYNDIQVRYEVVPSVDVAKEEVKKRVKSFVEQHKTTPAYN